MRWNDEALRSAYRQSPGPPVTGPCPDEETVERYLLGGLGTPGRERLADHLEGCADCAELVQRLGRLSEWAGRAAAASRPSIFTGRRLQLGLTAIAAALVLAIGGSAIWNRTVEPPSGRDVERAPQTVVSPLPGERLQAPPVTFDWPDEAGAAGYRLRLFGPGADLLFESDPQPDSDYRLPAAVAADLVTGGRYSWTVEVDGPVQRRQLGPYGFEIEP